MASFEVSMTGDRTETVGDVDAYAQEGQMTTFFQLDSGRSVIDCWSRRVASIRTADILMIRRL